MLSSLLITLSSLIGDSNERSLHCSNGGNCLTNLPENAETILNNNNAALNLVDQALNDIITATEKLKTLNDMMTNAVKEVKDEQKAS